jgi:activator of HSP90 ATPase
MKIKTDNIFQVVELPCSAHEAYMALTDATLLSSLTGMTAEMDTREGGVFHAWNNRCHGYMLYLKEDCRIVQSWRHSDFPEGIYTTVVFDIETTESGSRVSFNHVGVPEEASGWLTEAWRKDFWEPITEHLSDRVAEA